ncbi:MAG: HAD-IIA family hydrolase [Nocardioides sp.]|nr:HAD-IIA family hydrolase [Nocardioides sp.]
MSATSGDPASDLLTGSLIDEYDGVICDLDGVVYRGPMAVPGAVETLNHVVTNGIGVVFATNNASRPPEEIVEHLRELGLDDYLANRVEGRGWSVVTSSQSAAAHLAQRLEPGAPVLAVGGPGVAQALTEVGLVPVRVAELADTPVEAIVQGLGVDVTWRELAEVGYLVQRGVTWVATNLDLFLPTAHGPAPGNGALVAAVRTTTTRTPRVTGKPGAALFELGRTKLGTDHARTLVCGDRLDTDIAGANAAGLNSLLLLSGASTLQDLALAREEEQPTYVASDLTGMLAPAVRPPRTRDAEAWDVLAKRLDVGL